MTEDNRIHEIRAVLDRKWPDYSIADMNFSIVEEIRTILRSAPPAPGPGCYPPVDGWDGVAIGQEPLEPHASTATTARRRDVHITQTPAPRVFFRDDEVPSGVRVMAEDGRVHPEPEEFGDGIPWSANFTTVEVMGPAEWQATVDRAKAARADSEWQHTEGVNP